MFTYKKENQLPIKSWIPKEEYYSDEKMVEQVENLAKLPFAFRHIVLSPDGHVGFGMPIGGVLATKEVIVPNAVGVDIGCGMCAVKTSLTNIDTNTLKKIMGEIRKSVPVGFSHQKEAQDEELMPQVQDGYQENETKNIPSKIDMFICNQEYNSALKQIGTLGGGNHFIEIQKGSDGHIWIMIHSGSRNLGKKVADYYNKVAKELNERWYSTVPLKWDLAFLPINTEEGKAYIEEMNYCVDFALANRTLMMNRILSCFATQFNCGAYEIINEYKKFNSINSAMINIAHNYAEMENHFGENVIIHRKGATLARKNTIGIIPGSQGTSSYIVQGKGNPDSFMSCSHGAGRKMSRKQAIDTLDLEEEKQKMGDIVHGLRNKTDLDEAPGSYKDISKVMENQKDLVDILVELKPLAVIKG